MNRIRRTLGILLLTGFACTAQTSCAQGGGGSAFLGLLLGVGAAVGTALLIEEIS